MPEVHYWMGRPVSEIPREELEQLFVEACKKINDMNGQFVEAKINHINDLAAVRKRHG